jgi:hypothetical protein
MLKESQVLGCENIAGIVGGTRSGSNNSDHELPDINLKDVSENEPAPSTPVQKPCEEYMWYGQIIGDTPDYQFKPWRNTRQKRNFFYTGQLKTVTLSELQDVSGGVGRVSIGLKTEIKAWEFKYPPICWRYHSEREARKLQKRCFVKRKVDNWVSSRSGIAVGFRIRKNE